ncbi:MAG: prepilin-type N-terminal cleavage/methylation domain-containing protein [Alicyclobacillaceae bacterium]|nr:prepilin-type N-terminal cleavage/methylation domain-containing protein [Alicyclobacillaceae bacterium]
MFRSRHARGVNRFRGFTLVEMAAALALTGTLIVLTVPGVFRWAAYWDLYVAAQRLAEDLRDCQSRAEAEGVYYEIRFLRLRPDYTVYRGVQPIRSVRSPRQIEYLYGSFPLPTTHVRFTPEGTGTFGATIWLKNGFGDRLAVRIYLDTGVVVHVAQ